MEVSPRQDHLQEPTGMTSMYPPDFRAAGNMRKCPGSPESIYAFSQSSQIILHQDVLLRDLTISRHPVLSAAVDEPTIFLTSQDLLCGTMKLALLFGKVTLVLLTEGSTCLLGGADTRLGGRMILDLTLTQPELHLAFELKWRNSHHQISTCRSSCATNTVLDGIWTLVLFLCTWQREFRLLTS